MLGVELWSREQAERVYRRFGQDFGDYQHFVFVDYIQVSTKRIPMNEYRATHDVGVFLVAVDCSDCRHVLCGFHSEDERNSFLATSDILIERCEEYD